MLQICPCRNSIPEFVEVSVVFESLVVLSRPLSWRSASGPYCYDTDFASAFHSSTLRNCGCSFHASLQLAFRENALQCSAAVPPKTPSLSYSCSLILQFFLFDLNLGSTSQPPASLLRHSSSQPEASRDRPSILPAQFGVTLQALSAPPGQLQSLLDRAPIFLMRPQTLSFQSPL